jgi:hypothetical protein
MIRLFGVAQAARPAIFVFCLRVERPLRKRRLKMALHRDIYWVGRQWAVTGHGMQAVDQKQKSKFDIEVSRLWEDDLFEILRDQTWFNAEDFSKGLSIARARYPEPPGGVRPQRKAASEPAPLQKAALPIERIPERVAPVKVSAPVAAPAPIRIAVSAPVPIPVEPAPKPVAPKFHLRIENSPAKLVRPWRIRIKP